MRPGHKRDVGLNVLVKNQMSQMNHRRINVNALANVLVNALVNALANVLANVLVNALVSVLVNALNVQR